jgi:hypothetical protein
MVFLHSMFPLPIPPAFLDPFLSLLFQIPPASTGKTLETATLRIQGQTPLVITSVHWTEITQVLPCPLATALAVIGF